MWEFPSNEHWPISPTPGVLLRNERPEAIFLISPLIAKQPPVTACGWRTSNQIVEIAIGGNTIGATVDGRERYPISVRYSRDFRDNIDALKRVLVATPTGQQVPISLLADIRYQTGPPDIRDENGQLVGYVFVDITSSDIDGYVRAASRRINERVQFPPGYYIHWAGQFQ